jgi:glycosyltransferase involved in cell wall biosynthesis
MPVYNCEQYVAQAIESILAQSFQDFRLLISDNASTDGTPEICARYAALDSRVTCCRNDTNLGLSANFNLTFTRSDAKYFKWASGDDYCSMDLLQEACQILEADQTIVACYPKVVLVDAKGAELQTYADSLQLMDDDPVTRYVNVVSKIKRVHEDYGLIRSDVLRRTSLLAAHTRSDINLVAEISLYGKLYELQNTRMFRRMHPDASSWQPGSDAHQVRRYYGADLAGRSLGCWRYHSLFVTRLLRSPLRVDQKLSILPVLLKHMYWDRELRKELIEPVRSIFARRVRT